MSPFRKLFNPLSACSVAEMTPMQPPVVDIIRRSPRLCTVGSLNLPTSHEAATSSGSLRPFVSVPASLSRNTPSSVILNGLPWPTKLNSEAPSFRLRNSSVRASGLVPPGPLGNVCR
jgi:hypothetical protein